MVINISGMFHFCIECSLVLNYKCLLGSDVVNSLKRTENQHTPYIGPGPGENTGTHRYTFLLYKQLKKQSFSPMEHEKRENRRLFNINQFVTENQLELVSANFFCCPT